METYFIDKATTRLLLLSRKQEKTTEEVELIRLLKEFILGK